MKKQPDGIMSLETYSRNAVKKGVVSVTLAMVTEGAQFRERDEE